MASVALVWTVVVRFVSGIQAAIPVTNMHVVIHVGGSSEIVSSAGKYTVICGGL
jgi:hypothetical protein